MYTHDHALFPTWYHHRAWLYQRLDDWQTKRMIVVHAPAGYGKSSFITQWIHHTQLSEQVLWVQCSPEDAHQAIFMTTLIRTFQRRYPTLAEALEPLLSQVSGTITPVLQRLFSLIADSPNERHDHSTHMLVVIDDMHHTLSPNMTAFFETWYEQAPPFIHLCIITRHRTHIPLARIQAHQQLILIESHDLAFRAEDIREFLKHHQYPDPTDQQMQAIITHSDGWITALKLAMLATHDTRDMSQFIHMLHGHQTWVTDFFIEEILNKFPQSVRLFLLYTSILNEFNDELCRFITHDIPELTHIQPFAHSEFFLIPLNNRPGFFRYHHVFQHMLQHHLHHEISVAQQKELHIRAIEWYITQHDIPNALTHIIHLDDVEYCHMYVCPELRKLSFQSPHEAHLMFHRIPYTLIERSTHLLLDRCFLAMMLEHKDLIEYVTQLRRHLAKYVPDYRSDKTLYGHVCFIEAITAYMTNAIDECQGLLQEITLYEAHMEAHFVASTDFLRMHIAAHTNDIQTAIQSAKRALHLFTAHAYHQGVVSVQRELSRLYFAYGQTHDAHTINLAIYHYLDHHHVMASRDTCLALISAVEQYYWQNDLANAEIFLLRATDIARRIDDTTSQHICEILTNILAVIRHEQLSLHYQFSISFDDLHMNLFGTIKAMWHIHARILTQQSTTAEYKLLSSPMFASLINSPYYHSIQIMYFKTVLNGDDMDFHELPMLQSIQASAHVSLNVQLTVLEAWHELKRHGVEKAKPAIEHAITAVNQTGYVRYLLDIPDLVHVLPACKGGETITQQVVAITTPNFTRAELAVIQLLARNHSYKTIAQQLFISINTVRFHVSNIYRKLNVRRRSDALLAISQLGLTKHTPD